MNLKIVSRSPGFYPALLAGLLAASVTSAQTEGSKSEVKDLVRKTLSQLEKLDPTQSKVLAEAVLGEMKVLDRTDALAAAALGQSNDGQDMPNVESEILRSIRTELDSLVMGENPAENWMRWCSASSRIFSRERARARRAFDSREYARAKSILQDTLWAVAASVHRYPTQDTPTTKQLTVRGIILMNLLDAEIPDHSSPNALVSKVIYLTRYTEFVESASAFDRKFFIPYQEKRNSSAKDSDGMIEMQRAYFGQVAANLRFALDLVLVHRNPETREVVSVIPNGSEVAFFRTAEFLVRWAAYDVASNWFSNSKADVIEELRMLADALARHREAGLAPGRGYPGQLSDLAVYGVRSLERVIQTLEAKENRR